MSRIFLDRVNLRSFSGYLHNLDTLDTAGKLVRRTLLLSRNSGRISMTFVWAHNANVDMMPSVENLSLKMARTALQYLRRRIRVKWAMTIFQLFPWGLSGLMSSWTCYFSTHIKMMEDLEDGGCHSRLTYWLSIVSRRMKFPNNHQHKWQLWLSHLA